MKRFIAVLAAAASLSALASPAESKDRPVLDVVFALDTTSSMGGLLEGAKQKIWSLASRMAAGQPTPRLRVGLVAYRDRGDAYVTKVVPLTEDLDAVYAQLKSLRPEGGGDGPEAVQTALFEAVTRMTWTDAARAAKIIFLVGDAPAHDQDRAHLYASARKAIAAGIVVNTIRCGSDPTTEVQFREVSRLADGRFDSIAQEGGVVAVATPYDARLAELNAALMDTAVYAGTREARRSGEARKDEAKAMAAPAAADRLSYMSGSGRGAAAMTVGGSGTVDLTAEPEKAASVDADLLPPELKALSAPERVKVVKAKREQRDAMEKEIAALAKKRDEFVAKAPAAADSFDTRVFEGVKARAAAAGITYR